MTGFTVIDGVLALGYVVVDAVGLYRAFDARIIEPERDQFCFDGFFFGGSVDGEFAFAEAAISICIECRDDVSGVFAVFKIHSFKVNLANRTGVAIGVIVDPVEGSDQIVWSQHCVAIYIRAVE